MSVRGLALSWAASALTFAAAALPLAAQHKTTPATANIEDPSTSIGKVDAPVSVIAFIDLECPFSAATVPLIEAMAKAHPEQVHLQLRQFPLNQHAESVLAHEAALAAGAQGRYFDMVDLIQANQKLMTRDQYLHYAERLHLNMVRFKGDLDAHRYLPQVQTEVAEGNALGVDVTPTLYINGRQAAGAQTSQALAEMVNLAAHATTEGPAVPADDVRKGVSAELWKKMLDDGPASFGPADAPITIVEFTDFQCPFCRRSTGPMRQLVAASGGKVRWVYRSFPLDIHDQSQLAAEAALAAGAQGKFWQMHDLLFAQQDGLDRSRIDAFASQLGLDMGRFQNDLKSGTFRAAIAADKVLGDQAGVDGTPSFFINGHMLTGTRTLPELQQAVALATQPPAATATATQVAKAADHVVAGSADAANSVVWFSDVEAAAAPEIGHVVQKLLEREGSEVRVVLKSYALPGHASAAMTHRALLAAAAQDRFWPMYYALAGRPLPVEAEAAREKIVAAAAGVGINGPAFAKALNAEELGPQIEADHAEATRRGVRGVPVLFVNDKRIDGVQPMSIYEEYLQVEKAGLGGSR